MSVSESPDGLAEQWMREANRWRKMVAAIISQTGPMILQRGHIMRVVNDTNVIEEVTAQGLHLSIEVYGERDTEG